MSVCGIVAVWQRDGANVDAATLAVATRRLRHRGPDGRGCMMLSSRDEERQPFLDDDAVDDLAAGRRGVADVRGDVGLGHTRLSLVDLSPRGRQPMGDDAAPFTITYNGELYNYRELRTELQGLGHRFTSTSDTEVVLHAYEEWGVAAMERFVGMWAFALWDGRQRRLVAARDRLGIKPLVYFVDDRHAVCASELRALVAFPFVPRDVDPVATHHYLSLGDVPAPWTMYEQVRKLPAGHHLIVEEGSAVVERYYDLPGPGTDEGPTGTSADELVELLGEAVRSCLVADVPVGLFLSGGVDSSVVGALAGRAAAAPVEAFTQSYAGLPEYDESEWARRVARHVGATASECEFGDRFCDVLREWWAYTDEPFVDAAGLGVFVLARQASGQVKAVLTGDGGDEVFSGYVARYADLDARLDGYQRRTLSWVRSATSSNVIPGVRWRAGTRGERLRRRRRSAALGETEQRQAAYFGFLSILSEAEKADLYADDWAGRVGGRDTFAWFRERIPTTAASRIDRWQRLDLQTSLPDQMLAKTDRATMAWGLEARVPLLDHRVVAAALALPDRLRIEDGVGKTALRAVGERLLPAEVLQRAKHGFNVPLADWVDGRAIDVLGDTLSAEAVRRHGVLRPEAVAALVDHHLREPTDHSGAAVLAVASLHAWLDGGWERWG